MVSICKKQTNKQTKQKNNNKKKQQQQKQNKTQKQGKKKHLQENVHLNIVRKNRFKNIFL